ncbi:MAG: hypothetical protein AAFP70_08830 [Calditrichota bacterium]
MNAPKLSPDLFKQVFTACYDFAGMLVGERKASKQCQESYMALLPYFYHLNRFDFSVKRELDVLIAEPGDNELLAFAAWMQLFLRYMQNELAGLDNVDIRILTGEYALDLEPTNFYDYYLQASRLEY